jgi:DNA-binding GntR family transcriptional regulator
MKTATSGLTRIEQPPQTLRDIVQDKLREAIIEGHFKPGERLVERPLCDQLGVSRTVIRETIRYLEAEGLVEILPGKGPIVAQMNWEDARQIYEIRRMLESAAAAACAENCSEETAARLTAALAVLKASFSDAAPGGRFRATTAFYEAIFDGAGHNIAWEVVRRLNGRISRLRAMTLSTETRRKPGPAHMEAICKAILAGKARDAAAAVEAHIKDASEIACGLLAD